MTTIDPNAVDMHLAQGLRERAADRGDEDRFYEQVLATIALQPQRRWFGRRPAGLSRRTHLLLVAAALVGLLAWTAAVGGFLGSRPATPAAVWTATGPMITDHAIHTATLLLDGRVLLTGGVTEGDATDATGAAAELYDSSAGSWTATGSMISGRWDHTATRLLDGRVLVAGGAYPATSELYDPRTGTWTATGNLVEDRIDCAATLLPDGTVLVAGAGTAELYDPRNGTWVATGAMIDGRYQVESAATLLPDGRVLLAGGAADASYAELYDPRTRIWTATGPMIQRHGDQLTATLLPDGTVLVAGGTRPIVPGIVDPAIPTADLYDPRTGTWTAAANMNTNRRSHSATLLPDGRVLVAGGINHDGAYGSAELFHPGTGN
jgi:hypothetical protein